MRYNKTEKIDIGRQVYTHEIGRMEAAAKYGICMTTIENYIKEYKQANGMPVTCATSHPRMKESETSTELNLETYKRMSKEELIDELIRARVAEARAKKGYEVKGDGQNKVYNSLNNKNSK